MLKEGEFFRESFVGAQWNILEGYENKNLKNGGKLVKGNVRVDTLNISFIGCTQTEVTNDIVHSTIHYWLVVLVNQTKTC